MITPRRSMTGGFGAAMAAASLFVGLLLPAAVLAKPSDETCAAYRVVPFSTPAPAGMRTAGTHRFQYRSSYLNADGTTGTDDIENQIAIVPGTPLYPNKVLLRLFSNLTLLSNGDIDSIDEMAPNQPASLYVAAYSIKSDHVFLDSFRLWYRYEGAPGRWSAWTELARGPVANFCNQVTNGQWKKTFGWD